MIAARQHRDPEILARYLSETLSAIRQPGLSSVQRLLLHASVAAYRHALAQDVCVERIHEDVDVLVRSRRVSPSIALMTTGLCAFWDLPDLAAQVLEIPLHRLSGGAQPQRIFRAWRSLYAAAHYGFKHDFVAQQEALAEVGTHLAKRISRDAYFQITTLAAIATASAYSDESTHEAIERRANHLALRSRSQEDSYHPASLLDLHGIGMLFSIGASAQSAFLSIVDRKRA